MKDYYFKYVVSDSLLTQFDRFKPASRHAKKLEEKVYLTTFSYSNSFKEPYDEAVITSVDEIAPSRKKLIGSFYKTTGTIPMTRKDYRIAYKFLKGRVNGHMLVSAFQGTISLPEEQQNRIYKFLRYNHQVKFI